MKIKELKYTLSKTKYGLEYILFPDKKSYSTTIQILTKTGSVFDKIAGESHFLEHMVYRSSTEKGFKQKQKELEFRGSYKDGVTSYEYNEYVLNIPYTQIKWGFEYVADLLSKAALIEKEFELERKVIIDEISKSQNNPYDLLYEINKRNYLTIESPFYNDIAGTKDTMLSITQKDLSEFYLNYNNSNIVMGVSGKFSEEKVVNYISELSEHLNECKNKKLFVFKDIIKKQPIKVIIEPSKLSKNTLVCISHLEKGIKNTSRRDSTIDTIFSYINITGESSPLYQALREDSGYLYGYYQTDYTYNPVTFSGLIFESENEYVYEILNTIKKTYTKISNKKIKIKDLNHWKNYVKNRILIRNDSHSSILKSLVRSKFNYNNIYTPKELLEIVEQISLDDVNALLPKLTLKDKNVVIFGNTKNINHEKISKIFN